MHHIDRLLNELEMLNLADQRQMPPVLSVAINKDIEESPEVTVLAQAKPASVLDAMDALYEIQDSLMYNQIEDEEERPSSQLRPGSVEAGLSFVGLGGNRTVNGNIPGAAHE